MENKVSSQLEAIQHHWIWDMNRHIVLNILLNINSLWHEAIQLKPRYHFLSATKISYMEKLSIILFVDKEYQTRVHLTWESENYNWSWTNVDKSSDHLLIQKISDFTRRDNIFWKAFTRDRKIWELKSNYTPLPMLQLQR